MLEDHQHSMQVEEEPWLTRWRRVMSGLNAPRDSGEYKYSIAAIQRIFGPGSAAIAVQIIVILLLLLFVKFQTNQEPPDLDVSIVEQEVIEELEKPEEIEMMEEVDMSTLEPTMEDAPSEVSEVDESFGDDSTDELVSVEVVDFVKSPMVLKGLMGGLAAGRSSAARGNALDRYGAGGKGTETAVLKALRWLKDNQNADGSWSGGSTAGMTGLALLCYMAHGETPASPEFGKTVEKAIRFLLDAQQSDGRFNDCGGHYVYGHALATYGLAESYGMTKIVMLREPVARACKVIVDGQQEGGAWDYNYAKGARKDLSVAAWQVQAMKATKLSGIEVDGLAEALELSVQGIKSFAATPSGTLSYGGGGGGSLTLTAAGVLCLQLLRKTSDPLVGAGLAAIEHLPCDWEANLKHNNTYSWYYGTQAKFQQGGPTWTAWNDKMLPMLVKNQKADGHWDSGKTHGANAVYDTTLCCLSLEVYYRYLPTYIRVEEVERAPKTKEERDIKIGITGAL